MNAHRSALDWTLEVGTVLVLAGMFVWLASAWPDLPDDVPRHYNAAGEPDAWGSKRGLWLLPVVGASTYLLLTAVGHFPSSWNLPAGVDRNRPEVQRLVVRLMVVIKFSAVVTLAYISWTGISVGLGRSRGLGVGFLPVFLLGTILPVLYFVLRLRRLRR
jgi:hypothetical protein